MKKKIKIGIPRAFLYYRHHILWKNFFEKLNCKIVLSPDTNKEIIALGKDYSIDESCLSSKVYMGHVAYLIDKCDYVLIPRISDYGKDEKVCIKFSGLYDIVVAGGAEQLDWVQALGFNAIRALSRKYNDQPEIASRPFDRDRDGFVLAGGAGYMILESGRSVARRGARPISEISGVASNSNASDMVVPDAPSCMEVMRQAVADAGLRPSDVTYVNTHGTATPVGDPVEMAALRDVFGSKVAINSTKSQTGHMVGATGAAEIIFTSIMMEKQFLSRSINLDNPEPEFGWADLIREYREGVRVRHALSNSFAFGGSNVSVVISDCGN